MSAITPFERKFLLIQPFYPFLYRHVRHHLNQVTRTLPSHSKILDVGGRKSHYTIGIPAEITVSDLPRETELQNQLNLGINAEIVKQYGSRRSNIERIIYDDMTQSQLPDACFDCVVAVEVLEHVAHDELFVEQVHRVLKPNGVFLMTTPNGDHVPNDSNPDHKRHYGKEQLYRLLKAQFASVSVDYSVCESIFWKWGLMSWSPKSPLKTIKSMTGNFVSAFESKSCNYSSGKRKAQHLFAMAYKQGNSS